ncbi:ABC-three component system middle component 1 [Exiguobacterium sp. s36]|uniref:ABC-three component system middle component 1 n=1 Tax=Exiguobacterium sp. s36 TaxID=2751227 RepID=UPI001BE842AC|nr:ABC-three component system middle component 1 [Exiguobacterium sp. s36]
MKAEKISEVLKDNNFVYKKMNNEIQYPLEQLNIDSWSDDTRMIFIKEYRTKNSLSRWTDDDYVQISIASHFIDNKFQNNLYFFMVLDFNSDDVETRLAINKIEKNDEICKKYILKSEEDINKIPFIRIKTVDAEKFDYDKIFKEEILKTPFDPETPDLVDSNTLLTSYFQEYLTDKKNYSVDINKILKIEEV